MKKPMNLKISLPEKEKDDLVTLFTGIIAVLILWILYLNWGFSRFASGGDAITQIYIFLQKLFEVKGDWTKVIYRSDILGGIKIHDVNGTMPLFQLFSSMGITPLASINLTVFIFQTIYAFMGVKCVISLVSIWNGRKEQKQDILINTALVLLFSFIPVLSWRIIQGHLYLIAALFSFLGLLTMMLAIKAGNLSKTSFIIIILAMINSIPTQGQQMLLYSAVFGGPLLIAAAADLLKNRETRPAILIPVLCGLAALAVSMPKMAGMLQNAASSDAARSLGGESIVFSYTTATVKDWLGSIPWMSELVNTGRTKFFLHETNYPFGPILLLLPLIPWKKARGFQIAMIISAIFTLGFSMNIYPFPNLLSSLIPPLKAFRVPARAILPLASVLPFFAAAGLLYSFPEKKGLSLKMMLPFIAAAFIMLILPPAIREILIWLFSAIVIISIFKNIDIKYLNTGLVLLIIATAGISAFKERLLPYVDGKEISASAKQIGQFAEQRIPELRKPLSRAAFKFLLPGLGPNQGAVMGISALDGYAFSPFRFTRLAHTISGRPHEPLAMGFRFTGDEDWFPAMQKLYNIKYAFLLNGQRLGASPLDETPGSCWFSRCITPVADFNVLSAELEKYRPVLTEKLKEQNLVVLDDPETGGLNTGEYITGKCTDAEIINISQELQGQRTRILVKNTEPCPLTLSMNYLSTFKAYGITDTGKSIPLRVFPAYGALTGIFVPADVKEITVEAAAYLPLWSMILFFSGILFIIAALSIMILKGKNI